MNMLKVYELVDTPYDRKHIDTRWVFKVKEADLGNVLKFKARWVIKGYMQSHGIYYNFTCAPVGRMSTLRMVLILEMELKLQVHQMDVSTAFLNVILNDTVYVKALPGVITLCQKENLCFTSHHCMG